jgi:hypothetical protein
MTWHGREILLSIMNKQKQLSPEKYITTKGGSLPFHECYINTDWQTKGMASLIVSKAMPSGKFIVGFYLVDIFCLGLKNTWYRFGEDKLGYELLLKEFIEQHPLETVDLPFVHNLIYGAIDYAEELGFSPNKDFKITEHLLDSDLIDDGIDEMEFGKDGKPFFVAGPYDNIHHIMGLLERNAGTGNFNFLLHD